MTKKIAVVMPYYDNEEMLKVHLKEWSSWPEKLRKNFQFVIVDDGTPTTPAAAVPRPDNIAYQFFRVAVDLPWHQHAARNIGAHEARAEWLMLTDMDLLIPQKTAERMLAEVSERNLHNQQTFTFARWDADTMKPKLHPISGQPHPHPNTFLMRKRLFWAIGGYDEDYCGIYGTDGLFRKRLWSIARDKHIEDHILRYSREFLADASTRTLPRKEGRKPGAKQDIDARKKAEGTYGQPKTLSMPYARVVRFDPWGRK